MCMCVSAREREIIGRGISVFFRRYAMVTFWVLCSLEAVVCMLFSFDWVRGGGEQHQVPAICERECKDKTIIMWFIDYDSTERQG